MNTTENDPFKEALGEHGCDVTLRQTLFAESSPLPGGSVATWLTDRLTQNATGWVQYSDANVWIADGKPSSQAKGVLIAAELFIPGAESYNLRHDGADWIARKIIRKDCPDSLLESRTLLHSDGKTSLTYEVAWQPVRGVLRPVAFRLVSPANR